VPAPPAIPTPRGRAGWPRSQQCCVAVAARVHR
jgi:hypothetical protein